MREKEEEEKKNVRKEKKSVCASLPCLDFARSLASLFSVG